MTRPGKRELPVDAHKIMARLMQLHHETHPKRIGLRFEVTGEYVRQTWTNMPAEEQARLEDVLAVLGVKI